MEKQIYRFTNEVDNLEVVSTGAKIIVMQHDENEIVAEYDNPKTEPEFCAVLNGNTLSFKEKFSFSFFSPKPTEGYTITVKVPVKCFNSFKVNTTSGGADIAGITAQWFELNTASGKIDINAHFDNVNIQSASGCIVLANPTGNTAKSVSVRTVSGNAEINGYKAEKYSIHSVSGNTAYNGATGAGMIAVTSGNINVDYAEWKNDLEVSAISGNISVILPADSGIDVKFNGASGVLKTDVGNVKGSFMNLGRGTAGQLGGENMHKVNINLTSGTVTIAQGGKDGINLDK